MQLSRDKEKTNGILDGKKGQLGEGERRFARALLYSGNENLKTWSSQ